MPWTDEARCRAASKRRATGKSWYSGPRIMGTRNFYECEVWRKYKRGETLTLEEAGTLWTIKLLRAKERAEKRWQGRTVVPALFQ